MRIRVINDLTAFEAALFCAVTEQHVEDLIEAGTIECPPEWRWDEAEIAGKMPKARRFARQHAVTRQTLHTYVSAMKGEPLATDKTARKIRLDAEDCITFEAHAGGNRYVLCASDLGLTPGTWPARIETDLGNKLPFVLTNKTDDYGSRYYEQSNGALTLALLND